MVAIATIATHGLARRTDNMLAVQRRHDDGQFRAASVQ